MGIPLRQQIRVGAYVLKQRLRRRARYPLVLMLEPLFRCNLACAGCGKICLAFTRWEYTTISSISEETPYSLRN